MKKDDMMISINYNKNQQIKSKLFVQKNKKDKKKI
jgi:hypothetical protein